MAKKTPVWQVTIHYADGEQVLVDDVRNYSQERAEHQVLQFCTVHGRKVDKVTSVQAGAKFSGQA